MTKCKSLGLEMRAIQDLPFFHFILEPVLLFTFFICFAISHLLIRQQYLLLSSYYMIKPCIVEANVMLMLEGFAIYFCSCIIASACNSLIKFYNSLREFDKYNKLQFMGLCCHESFLELFHFQLISVYRGLKLVHFATPFIILFLIHDTQSGQKLSIYELLHGLTVRKF